MSQETGSSHSDLPLNTSHEDTSVSQQDVGILMTPQEANATARTDDLSPPAEETPRANIMVTQAASTSNHNYEEQEDEEMTLERQTTPVNVSNEIEIDYGTIVESTISARLKKKAEIEREMKQMLEERQQLREEMRRLDREEEKLKMEEETIRILQDLLEMK